MGQDGKMASVPRVGWAHANEGGRWSWGQGCLLPAHWLALSPRMALALGNAQLAGSRRWQGAGGRPRKGSRLPAHPPAQGVCKGAGHGCPANNCSLHRLPGQAPGHSLPAFLLPPPSSFHSPPASDPQTVSGPE